MFNLGKKYHFRSRVLTSAEIFIMEYALIIIQKRLFRDDGERLFTFHLHVPRTE
jgi:hypothetical protein